jgi:hypothetical protein
MDLTMLRQICRHGRLVAMLSNQPRTAEWQLEDAVSGSKGPSNLLTRDRVPIHLYEKILAISRQSLATLRHYQHLPHPRNSIILPPVGHSPIYFEHGGRTFSTHKAHPGNGSIVFCDLNGSARTGFIDSVWKLDISGTEHIFIDVLLHKYLSFQDQAKNPFKTRPKLHISLVYAAPSGERTVIEVSRIIAHGAYWIRPSGTFGISKRTMIIHNTDRGRSRINYT